MRPAHWLLSFTGVSGYAEPAPEQWQFGVRIPVRNSDVNSLESDATDAGNIFASDLAAVLGNNQRLTKITLARVGIDGRWERNIDGSYRKGEILRAITGSRTVQPVMPASTALVASLVTGRAGPSGKGRIFLPIGRLALGPDGRVDSVETDFIGDAVRDFVSNINSQVGPIHVVSTKGFTSAVIGVRVGRVPDVMTSRRRDQPEQYSSVFPLL